MPFPFPLPPHPASLAVRSLNAMLEREPWARERLARHAGKTVRFALSRLDVSLTVQPGGLAELAAGDAEPAVVLTVVPERITLDRLRPGPDTADAFADMTHISGDAAFAQVVAELARHLRPDLQDVLAERIGDVAAVRLTQGVRAIWDGLRQGGERLAGNVAEYLSEESGALLARPVFEDLRDGLADAQARLDALDQRAARLDARVRRAELAANAGAAAKASGAASAAAGMAVSAPARSSAFTLAPAPAPTSAPTSAGQTRKDDAS